MLKRVNVRSYSVEDFDSLLTIQKEAFPPPFPEELWWTKEHIQAHVESFPNGGLLAEIDGMTAGSATSLRINFGGSYLGRSRRQWFH
ncbi:hypothetical protein LGQ02_20295 [Bacillus shivajii]|uniref:hypothetical protein n=1 Tax=Bacillus shivajii TaxID=1983719 RepID=UPI001CF9E00D|nr:hypothetical protein [Bacillus shivajii]UCZ53087.1 hypothetical protein LGQ02_20295 [Bacillus shivajii]